MEFFALIIGLLIALSFHESAHAFVANRLGDPTARLAGRLTLNPFAHLDPWGTLALILFRVGWGKPVPINPANFRSPRRDSILVALAGPLSNLIVASFFAILYRNLPSLGSLHLLLSMIILINILLAVFNLIPIPPLDGSRILKIFISEANYSILEQLGLPLLLGIIFFSFYFPSLPNFILGSAFFIFKFLVGVSPTI